MADELPVEKVSGQQHSGSERRGLLMQQKS
jgi:hypothetical protein